MSERRPGHPSGRPIRKDGRRALGFTRRPFDEPLTPGLRKSAPANAIGFRAEIVSRDDDE